LSRTLYALAGFAGAAREQAGKEAPEVARQLIQLRLAIEQLRKLMFGAPASEQEIRAAKLGEFQRALFNDLGDTFAALREQDNREGLRIEDLPTAMRHRFVGVTGKQVLQVYPKKNVWQREHQEEFVRELRQALDPKGTDHPMITGTPVQLYEYTGLLKRSYEEAAVYSLMVIAFLVLVHFRSVTSLLLALLPVAIGSLWLGGLMGWWGIPLNPANIMTLPLIIGIGVTNGIHILNRFAEERTPSILAKSTGKAVLVSGLTTIAGFGSLALAKHRGIESLGYIMATGVATCMFAGLTCLPALLNLTTRRKNLPTKQPSAENARSALGREEPR
jgi:predicted RND superfamily exporter protein